MIIDIFEFATASGGAKMCRMIAGVGNIDVDWVINAAIVMSDGMNASHELSFSCPANPGCGIRHLDGWGVALLRPDGSFYCLKSALPIGTDTLADTVRSIECTAMVLHVRCASREDQKGPKYVHPIEIEEDGHKYYFFHNGYAPDVHSLVGTSENGWDSEDLLAWLRPSLFATFNDSALRERLTLLPASTVAANCMCFGPDGITVVNWFSQNSESPHYYTMHFLQGNEVQIMASEQIPYRDGIDSWRPLGNGTILQIPYARV
ncbi:MAG: class II glutamine amidotransferase [Terracidiphilus sp.]